jgi:hypothetical protein
LQGKNLVGEGAEFIDENGGGSAVRLRKPGKERPANSPLLRTDPCTPFRLADRQSFSYARLLRISASVRARLASEQVLNDGDLRTGDIISTDRGFFQFRGLNVVGSYDLAPVQNPLSQVKAKGR